MPFLGVCLGLQLAVVEFARNKLGLADASSSELQQDSKNEIIIEMPEFNPVTKGGTMRLGKRRTVFTKKRILFSGSSMENQIPLMKDTDIVMKLVIN